MPTDELAGRATAALAEALDRRPDGVWFAPGRVNLIGEHTDYNDGFVLPLALPLGAAVAAAKRDDGMLRLTSANTPGVREIALSNLTPGQPGGWSNYVAGTAWALIDAGHQLGGADLAVASNVPLGAGLSSSAALECAAGLALAAVAGVTLTPTELAAIARHAENDYAGMPCGWMDQMASVHGSDGHLIFLDTRSLEVEPIPLDLSAARLALLVVDTRAPHQLVDGAYADRRNACHAAAHSLGLAALRDVSDLRAALAALDDQEQRKRVRHVVTENERVLRVSADLKAGHDPRTIGPLMNASHISLRDDFEVTVPELDVAVEAARAAGAYGARMTGGGFGGSIIALVDATQADAVGTAVSAAFARRGFNSPAAFTTVPADGARRLW